MVFFKIQLPMVFFKIQLPMVFFKIQLPMVFLKIQLPMVFFKIQLPMVFFKIQLPMVRSLMCIRYLTAAYQNNINTHNFIKKCWLIYCSWFYWIKLTGKVFICDLCNNARNSLAPTRFNHFGTRFFLSPLKYRLITITDKNVDKVIRIIFKQKYAPENK